MTEGKSSTTPAVMTASGNASGTQVNLKKMASHQGNKTQKPRTKPAHPRTAEMVNVAIKTLKERGGSSLQAIKKYISTTYKIDADKQAPFIKKYLKAAVTNGNLIQTKGKGAAGSFKLSVGKTEISKIKKKPTIKSTAASPLKKATAIAKKPAVVKKPTVKKVAAKKPSSKLVTVAEKRKTIKGPAAKPPKVKSAAKVKATPKPTTKKTPAVKKSTPKAKAKRPAVAKRLATKKK